MRRVILIACSIIAVAGVAFEVGRQPTPVSAGGWPCFLCHGGFEVLGTDLAPQLAGSKLTDEQILAQVRKPRGVMPAFSAQEFPDQVLRDGFIQPFMRGLPAGRPTAGLSGENRAMALATIAAVAATRSNEYARLTGFPSIETPTSLPRSPTPAASPTLVASPARTDPSYSPGALAAIGGLLLGMVAVAWFGMRR
jgi:hypothetical protein